MRVSRLLRRGLPFGLFSLLLLNTALGCWCGRDHNTADAALTAHYPGHVGCPPGSHGKPWWADHAKALHKSRDPAAGHASVPIEARSFVRVAGSAPAVRQKPTLGKE